ncbi:MAG: DUF1045 domain-containing protein [Magnetospirillum gryphiswaldense]|nr:DUF1045 domain-containing protein [Magnetospirillum gryphiswaldense]
MTTRYAIYFLPEPSSALMRLGQVWLDRLPRQLTAEARPYGFHATLKAPFRLAEGCDEAQLVAACADFAARHRGVIEAPPALAVLNGFFALRPSLPSDAIQSLGAACVRDFDRFRAPLTPAERAKRLKSPLSARSRQLLEDWGYPYVFEEYRFHMTLTCRVEAQAQAEVAAMLQPLVAEACAENLEIRSICLVRQDPGSDFTLVERFALGAPCAS